MKNWIAYAKERFPIPVYAVLSGGFAFSGLLLFKDNFSWLGFTVSFAGILLFFFELRLMDELKDIDKDVIAHPGRPLPRGLISRKDAHRAVMFILFAMILYAVAAGILLNLPSAISYLAATLYLWLMYKEFFVGDWLEERPLLYAVSHQMIIFAVCIFAVAVTDPEKCLHPDALYLGLTILGSFFTYEICRKLDPKAHPALKTYPSVYGPERTALIVILSTALAGLGAIMLELSFLLWPAGALPVLLLPILGIEPKRFRIVEGAATGSLTFHLWAVAIRHLLGWPT